MFLVPLEMFWIRVECWRCGKRVLHLATCFFIPFPIHNLGNVFFSFISCSRIVGKVFSGADGGQGFFHSLPVPEFREWIFSIPFPFPNFGNGFFQFPSRSRILKSHSRSPLAESLCGRWRAAPSVFQDGIWTNIEIHWRYISKQQLNYFSFSQYISVLLAFHYRFNKFISVLPDTFLPQS